MFGCFRCKTLVELVETDVYSVMRIQAINSFIYRVSPFLDSLPIRPWC